jgi:hypothetical protein
MIDHNKISHLYKSLNTLGNLLRTRRRRRRRRRRLLLVG